jgi:hypothetical protein
MALAPVMKGGWILSTVQASSDWIFNQLFSKRKPCLRQIFKTCRKKTKKPGSVQETGLV